MNRIAAGLASLVVAGAGLSQPAPAPAPPPVDRSSQPELTGSPDVARPADYPAAALKQRLEGLVRFELEIDERGRPIACTVQRSSGHAVLDSTACRIYRSRARYKPGRDADGESKSGKDQRAVDWRVGPGGPEALDIDSPDLLNAGTFVRSDDYPAAAISSNQQGTVTALVQVGSDGAIQSCTIEQSSGSTALDSTTCELLTTRGRFEPARDEQGRAHAGELRQVIGWRLEESPSYLTDLASQLTMRFDALGKRTACDVQLRIPGVAERSAPCPPGAPIQAPEHLLDQLVGGRALAISEQWTIVDESKLGPMPPLQPGERLLSEYRIRLRLDEKGNVINCEVLHASPERDVCSTGRKSLSPVMINGKAAAASISVESRNYLRFANRADAGPLLLNPGELVTEKDYPPAAIDADHQGSVGVRVGVDSSGRASSCAIDRSSGSTALDEETCRLVTARARYRPAADNQGRPLASEHRQTITWKLEDPPAPFAAWTERQIIILVPPGTVASCRLELEGARAASPKDCSGDAEQLKALGPVASAVDHRARVIFEVRFVPREMRASELPSLDTATFVARQVLKLSISPQGQLAHCEVEHSEGPGPPAEMACGHATGPYDMPASSNGAAGGSRPATLIITFSVQAEAVT